MELQVLAAPRWLCVGWNSLFPHRDLGLGLNQCSQHIMELFPFPTLPPSKDEAMESWEGDYPRELIEISSKNRGRKFWKGDLGSGNAWEESAVIHHFGIFFIVFPLLLNPLHPSWMPQLSQLSTTGTRCCSRKTAGKLQEKQPGVTLRDKLAQKP